MAAWSWYGRAGCAERRRVCPHFRASDRIIRTISLVARFDTAVEVTLDELRIEPTYSWRGVPAHGRADGGVPPARQSRQMALKCTLRGACGGAWMVSVNVLSAILRRRSLGMTNWPSAWIAAA
jgi:hypothetical protein